MIVFKDRWYRDALSRLLPFYAKRQRDRHMTALHEAGHAIVAHHLGREVTGIFLEGSSGWREACHGMSRAERRNTAGLCCWVAGPRGSHDYEEITIQVAGMIGTAIGGYGAEAVRGCGSDLRDTEAVLAKMPLPGSDPNLYWLEFGKLARSIIEMDIERFAALTQALILHGSVYGDVAAYIDQLEPFLVEHD